MKLFTQVPLFALHPSKRVPHKSAASLVGEQRKQTDMLIWHRFKRENGERRKTHKTVSR